MKRILGLALGDLSTGELIIAHSFADNLNKRDYSFDFLIPEDKSTLFDRDSSHQIYSLRKEDSPVDNQRNFLSLARLNNYDLIILFDAFTMEYAQSWTGINMDLLKSLSIPLASLDEYDYRRAGYRLDYYGVFLKRLPDLLSKMDVVFKNCPLSMPKSESNQLVEAAGRGEFYYKVVKGKKRPNQSSLKDIEKTYKRNGRKLVFLTLSQWELDGAYSFTSQSTLCKYLLPLIYNYLSQVDFEISLVHVGASCWEEEKFNHPNIDYIYYKSLPIEEFEEILQITDLYITYNLVSISLTKAIDFGVNSLVLNNDKIIDFRALEKKCQERPMWYQEMASDIGRVYPFTASMFGWNHFLKGIMQNNVYMDSFQRLQVFNTKQMESGLRDLLGGRLDKKLLANRTRFEEELAKIPDPSEALDSAFQFLQGKEGYI